MLHYTVEKKEKELWLKEENYSPVYAKKTESVFAQCNGYFGVRASHAFPTLEDQRGMFVAGVFNRAYPEEVTELVNAPDLTAVELFLNGEKISLDTHKPEQYLRRLNIRTGELREKFICTGREGLRVQVEVRRFASMEKEHLFAQQFSVTPLNGTLEEGELITGIDGRQTNSGVSHFRKVDCRVYDKRFMETSGTLENDVLTILSLGQGVQREPAKFVLKRRSIFGRYQFAAAEGTTWTFEKFSYIQKKEDGKELRFRQDFLDQCGRNGYEEELKIHQAKMEKLWDEASIKIKGAGTEEEAAIAFAQYHLMGMMPWNTSSCSIAAKGLTGEGYKGHVFWDTEIFMLSFFQYTFPEAAKHLLEYRYRGLEGARIKAAQYGYRGAMYPWETAKTGQEETPLYAALNIHTGKANKVWSGIKEHHVTADIAYAVWQYYSMTGDWDFMERCGCEILFEAAEFWASRACWEEKKNCYVIKDIIGPDEYTEHVDNNAYTNYMAWICLSMAVKLYERMLGEKGRTYQRLEEKLQLSRRAEEWKAVGEKLYLPVPNREGIIPQDDTFLGKARIPNIEKYRNSPVKQSVLLDYSRDEVVDMQVLKQADVVMLLNLFPHWFDREIVKKNVLFYEERTIHDSSLSYCAHAQACAAIGESRLAWKFFEKALVIDLDESPGDSAEGVHAASLGGIWNCVIGGFAGVSFEKNRLQIEPRLPGHWEEMSFSIHVRGSRIFVNINKKGVHLQKEAGDEEVLPVIVGGQEIFLKDSIGVKIEE